MFYSVLFVYSYLCCVELATCPFYYRIQVTSKANVSFYAFIMNNINKVLLYYIYVKTTPNPTTLLSPVLTSQTCIKNAESQTLHCNHARQCHQSSAPRDSDGGDPCEHERVEEQDLLVKVVKEQSSHDGPQHVSHGARREDEGDALRAGVCALLQVWQGGARDGDAQTLRNQIHWTHQPNKPINFLFYSLIVLFQKIPLVRCQSRSIKCFNYANGAKKTALKGLLKYIKWCNSNNMIRRNKTIKKHLDFFFFFKWAKPLSTEQLHGPMGMPPPPPPPPDKFWTNCTIWCHLEIKWPPTGQLFNIRLKDILCQKQIIIFF